MISPGNILRKGNKREGYNREWVENKSTFLIPAKFLATVIYSEVSWNFITVEKITIIISAEKNMRDQIYSFFIIFLR